MITFLISGRPEIHTKKLIDNIKKLFPDSRLITSATKEFTQAYDELKTEHFVLENVPMLEEENNRYLNIQIANAQTGLKEVGTKYVCRMRADMILTSKYFYNLYKTYENLKRSGDNNFTKQRIMISSTYTVKPDGPLQLPLHTGDWFHFGLTEDIRALYDIPLKTRVFNDNGQRIHRSEQYILIEFLKKKGLDIDIPYDNYQDDYINNLTKKIIANNFITFDCSVSNGLYCQKYPINNEILDRTTLYSHQEWIQLIEKEISNVK